MVTKRPGTLSILASLDLHDGHVVARVEERHQEPGIFVALLKDLDGLLPEQGDDSGDSRQPLGAHFQGRRALNLATRPNRFTYVHTPKHGSWLNLVEGRSLEKWRTPSCDRSRVKSKAELQRKWILLGIAEINAAPVVHRWKKLDLLAA